MSCLTIRTRTVATPDHPLTHTHIPSRTHSTSPLYTPYGFSQYASPGFVFCTKHTIMSNSSLVKCQVVLRRSESQKLKKITHSSLERSQNFHALVQGSSECVGVPDISGKHNSSLPIPSTVKPHYVHKYTSIILLDNMPLQVRWLALPTRCSPLHSPFALKP